MKLNKCTEYDMKNKIINSFSKRMGNNNIPLKTYYTRLYHNSNIGLFLVKHVVIWKTIVQSLISFKVFTRCNCKKLFLSIYNLRLQVKPNKDKLKWFLHVYLKLHLQKKSLSIYIWQVYNLHAMICAFVWRFIWIITFRFDIYVIKSEFLTIWNFQVWCFTIRQLKRGIMVFSWRFGMNTDEKRSLQGAPVDRIVINTCVSNLYIYKKVSPNSSFL